MLLHMDGAVGSTNLIDTVGNFTFSRGVGTGVIATTGKFNQCMNFPTNTYYVAPHHDLMNLTTQDFTIEAWVYPSGVNGPFFSRTIWSTGGYAYAFLLNNGKLDFYWTTNGSHASAIRITASVSISLNVWSHIAVSRVGSTLRLFQNGTIVGTIAIGTMYAVSHPLYIGGDPGSSVYYNGKMDEMRFINGTGLYTTNFTVPTAPFN